MPWVWDNNGNGNGRRRSRTRVNRNTRRSYRNGGYDNGYDAEQLTDDFDGEYADRDNGNGHDDFRLYDRYGTPVRIEVQSPRDMLPPRTDARDYADIRRRARF